MSSTADLVARDSTTDLTTDTGSGPNKKDVKQQQKSPAKNDTENGQTPKKDDFGAAKTTQKTFKDMSWRERGSYVRQWITVEPLIAAYLMSSVLCGPALITLEYEKACRVNLNYSDDICDAILTGNITTLKVENDEVQKIISHMHSWQTPIQSVVPLILVLFLGAYSDRHKLRKPFLVLPIFGEFFAVAACILCVVFMREWPLEAQGVAQTVVPSLFGGPPMILMAAFAYIADVSTLEMRTLRIGVLQIVLNICSPIVQSFSGILFYKIGYIWILLIAGGLYLFGFFYGLFVIKEPKREQEPIAISTITTANNAADKDGAAVPLTFFAKKLLFFKDAFDPTHLKDTFNLLLKESPGNNRLFVILILVLLVIFTTAVTGEAGLLFFYFQRLFQWTAVEYSYFSTAATVLSLIGTTVGISLFAKILKLGDLAILMITFSDKIITNLIVANAKSPVAVYIALAVSMITGISPIAIRSISSKIVSEDNLGKMQSLFSVFEAIGQTIGGPLYNSGIYVNTLEILPATIFYFSMILFILCIALVVYMFFKDKSTRTKVAAEENGGPENKGLPMDDITDVIITHI